MLLADVQTTPLAPLVARLLVAPDDSLAPLWRRAGLDGLRLADALEDGGGVLLK